MANLTPALKMTKAEIVYEWRYLTPASPCSALLERHPDLAH